MRAQIQAEMLKLRTTRSLYAALAVVALLTLALPVVNALVAGTGDVRELRPADLTNLLRAPVQLTGGALLLVGLLASAGEFRHRTVLTTRLAQPRARRVLAAIALTGFLTGAVVVAVTLVEAAVVFHGSGVAFEPFDHGAAQVALTVPLVATLYGLFGVAIGALLRNTAAALGVALVWAFVVEGLVPLLLRRPGAGNWLPGGLARESLTTHAASGRLAGLPAGLLLLGYAAALVALTSLLDARRELIR
jgi:ABC-2 type transport system permease protein